jgi:NADH:ubiquinone oxidoreductase subunit E
LGACALGPIVSENGSSYHHMTPGKLRKLIDSLSRETSEGAKHAAAQH